MPLETSRSIKHVVQRQSYPINMDIQITHNPKNRILKKAEVEMEYECSVKLNVGGKRFTVTGMMEEQEDFNDMVNRISKLAFFKLADSLSPSKHVHTIKFRELPKEKK